MITLCTNSLNFSSLHIDDMYVIKSLTMLTVLQDFDIEGELSEKASCYEGIFYNYFSIGMF